MAVLDASFLVKLVIREECSEAAVGVFERLASKGEDLHVPCITVAEVLNAVWKHVSLLKDLDAEDARRALQRLRRLSRVLEVHRVEEFAEEALEYALEFNITFYDATYVALAVRLRQDLYTFDERLASRLRGANLPVDIIIPECSQHIPSPL
jgi:predicted nucleic acid-binding protein